MKFLIDENIDRRIAQRLIDDGHEVRQVVLIEPSISDEAVLLMSLSEKEIVITDDKDFGDLVFHRGKETFGVILLRLEGLSGNSRATRVSEVVKENGAKLFKQFTLVSPSTVRIKE